MPSEEQIAEEFAAWVELETKLESTLSDASGELLSQLEEVSRLDDEFTEIANETIPLLEEKLEEAISNLEQCLDDKLADLREAISGWAECVETVEDAVEEVASSARELTETSFEKALEEIQGFFEEGFVEKLEAELKDQVENSGAVLETSKLQHDWFGDPLCYYGMFHPT